MDEHRDKIPRWFATRWAGAAVIAGRCGMSFERLWVTAGDGLRGALSGLRSEISEIPASPGFSARFAAAIVAYAGPMAEARARGVRVDEVARRDPDSMVPFRTALAEIAGEDDDGTLEARVSAACRDLFNTPKVWTAVNAVAGALQARRTLTFYEVLFIIDRLERESPL